MLPIYVDLFNLIFTAEVIPSNWSQGIIVPIYKNKGNPSLPSNYRPITLSSCLSKLFTSVLNQGLNVFTQEHSTLHENQAGFRKHYSTTDHIFTLHQ